MRGQFAHHRSMLPEVGRPEAVRDISKRGDDKERGEKKVTLAGGIAPKTQSHRLRSGRAMTRATAVEGRASTDRGPTRVTVGRRGGSPPDKAAGPGEK